MFFDTVAAMALAPCRHLPLAHAARRRGNWRSRRPHSIATCSPSRCSPHSSRNNRIESRFIHPSFLSMSVVIELPIRRRWSSPGRTDAANTSALTSSPSPPEESSREARRRRGRPRLRPPQPPAVLDKYRPFPASSTPPRRTGLPDQLRVSFPSDSAVSRPLFSLSPSFTSPSPPVSAGRRGHRVPGLGTGLSRPAGRPVPMEARPIARTGPAVRPTPSGHSPAWHPDWAGSEAGLLCH